MRRKGRRKKRGRSSRCGWGRSRGSLTMERRLWRDVAFKPMRNLPRVSASSSFISVHRQFLLALLLTFRIATAADEPAFFPLMAWGSAPNDPAALRKMHDCGLNVAGFASPAALDAIHAAGLKAIVND